MILMQANCDETHETIMVIVIEPDNLHRMEQADPITLEQMTQGGNLQPVKYPEGLRVLIAYESEPGRIYEMINQGRVGDMLKDLMRGYQYKPVDGKRSTFDWTKTA